MKNSIYAIASTLTAALAYPALAADHGVSFLNKAMQGDNSETTLGNIAAQRGASHL